MVARGRLIAGIVGTAVLGVAAYGMVGGDAPPTPQPARSGPPRDAVASTTPSAEARPVGAPDADSLAAASSRPADCLIEPSQTVKVNSAVEGIIAYIGAERGQFVHRGQVVAQLRSNVEQAALAAARARAANVYAIGAAQSRAEYLGAKQERSERLRSYLAKDAVEEAQANARSAAMQTREAELTRRVASLDAEQSQRLLAERTVRSPIDGVVTERAMAPGEYRSNQSSHILTIAQVNPLYVEVFAPISQLRSVNQGDVATVFPEDPVGGAYKARVTIIDRVFDAASGTFGIRLELPNPGNKLPAGLRCRIEFDT